MLPAVPTLLVAQRITQVGDLAFAGIATALHKHF